MLTDEEKALTFEFDPTHDYFADVDKIVPPYRLPGYQTHSLQGGAAFENSSGVREVAVGPQKTQRMPFIRYVRAVDPAGGIMPLSISTCRPSPEYPEGLDGFHMDRVLADKRRKGWLILERDEISPYAGKVGQPYCAWALAVAKKREAAHAKKMDEDAQTWMSAAQRKSIEMQAEQNKAQNEMTASLVDKVIAAVIAAQKASAEPVSRGPGRPPKSDSQP